MGVGVCGWVGTIVMIVFMTMSTIIIMTTIVIMIINRV